MFVIYCFTYKDRHTGLKFAFYARTKEIAAEMAKLTSSQGVVDLVSTRFKFIRKEYFDIPPQELERAQFEYISHTVENVRIGDC